ncbi:unnamed protein product [Rhodiola kirilowii]
MAEEDELGRSDSLHDSDIASTCSGISSLLSNSTTDDFSSPSSSSSTDLSGSFSDAPAPEVVVAAGGMAAEEEEKGRREKCVGRNNKGVTWGSTSVIGRRREMEDAIAVIPGFMSRSCDQVGGCKAPGTKTSSQISPLHFFGVYDGHGGLQVAKFCSERMHDVVADEWGRKNTSVDEPAEWQKKWESTFAASFGRADNEVLNGESAVPEMVGSTAVVAVLSGCQIITSNCGDSRAVLCRGAITIPLTIDQKPDRVDELMRIEGEGGKVINWNGARVFGVLAMSRAIGDWYLRPWIIPVPEITFMTRADEDECLILASDGLWDVMSNDEVGEVARRVLRRRRRTMMASDDTTTPAQAVADSLTEIAFGRNSSDNISIVVVDLKTKRKRQARLSA